MVTPFVVMNAGKIKAQISGINNQFDRATEIAIAAAERTMILLAEDMVAKAQARLTSRSGDLEGSGTVLDPVVTREEIVIRWGFNKEYARIRDQGGDIFPVKAKMLAIPLDPILTATGSRYASPREEANLELVPILHYLFLADKTTGEFHWLLTDHVHQEGNGFVSKTVEETRPTVAPIVAREVQKDLAADGGAR